jgi:hypothetical protein
LETKFGNTELQNNIVSLLKETDMPVSVDFVANRMSIGWGTARAILLSLSIQGRVKMEKTTKSLIFSLKREDSKIHV